MPLSAIVSVISLVSYVALMILVLRHGIRHRVNRIFLLYLVAMTYWQFNALMVSLSTSAQQAAFWYQMMLTGGVFSVLYYHFTQAYLHIRTRTQSALLALGYGIGLVLGILIMTLPEYAIASIHREETGLYVPEFAPLMYVYGLFVYLYLGLGMVNLVTQYRQSTAELARNRLRYLISGIVIVYLGAFSNFLPGLQGYPVDIVANLTNAVLIALAILRFQLLDMSVVVRKGLLYSIPTACVGAGYFLLVYLAVNLLHFVTGYQVLILSLAMAAITAVAVQPLWSRMQSWVDRLLFREKYDAGLMLQRLSRTAAAVLDLDRLARMILDEIGSTMHAEKAVLFVKEEGSGEFQVIAQQGIEPDSIGKLRGDHPLLRWLSTHKRVLSVSQVDLLPQSRALWAQERRDLERMEAELLVPLQVRNDLIGVLFLGPKRSGSRYSRDEQLTLSTLANQTAVAIENAWLFSLEQHKAIESAALLDIARAVTSTLDLTLLLEGVAQRTADVCAVDRCSILLLDEGERVLIPLMSQFSDGARNAELWRAFRQGTYTEPVDDLPPLRTVLEGREPVVLDGSSISQLPSNWTEPFDVKSLLAVPLISKDRVIGLMVLDHTEEDQYFTQEQIGLATTIGTQVSIAIENARLYEETIEEKVRTETILEEAFSGIMVVDADGEIVTVNNEVEATTGYASHELLGRKLTDLFGSDLLGDASPLSRVMATGERAAPVESTLIGRKGARDILLGVTPIREGYLLNFADITRLKDVDRLKSNIVANVSHELRAPLASIKAYAELLLDNLEGDDTDLRHRFLSIIDQETDWLTELINDLLDLSRLESEPYAAEKDLLSVSEIIRSVVTLLDIQVQKKGVAVRCEAPRDLPLIMADRELMTILIKNLISNAVKFSAEGGRIEVVIRDVGSQLVLEVADEGIGIPPEDLPNLFTKFYRSGVAKEHGIRGTGLGLVLVKEAVDIHGGTIEVNSQLGAGTRVTVGLPKPSQSVMEVSRLAESVHG